MPPAPPPPDSDALPRFGMIHGRFQPFHNGHWDYCRLALERCRTLIIGITNPDPSQIAREPSAEHRHRADANPFSFFDRQRMIRAALRDAGVPFERVIFIPFPVNMPERWPSYVPADAVHFVRVFSDWEQTKVDRLRAAGYTVEVLTPGADKTIDATEVRRRMRMDEDWRALVPVGVARVLEDVAADIAGDAATARAAAAREAGAT